MTYYPPPPPIGYAGPPPPFAPDPRPASLKAIAILAIIFGSLGVLGGLCALPQYLGAQLTPTPNPVMDAMRQDELLFGAMVGSLGISMALALLELVSGIGALSLRPWARKGLIAYAVLNITVTIVSLVLNLTVVEARSERILQGVLARNPQLNTATMAAAMRIGRLTGMILPALFMIWAAIVLVFMTRPNVKAAFEARRATS